MSDSKRQVPSIGRIVHYVAYGTPGGEYQAGAHRAAIITEVYEPLAGTLISETVDMTRAGLCVLNPTGIFFKDAIPFDPTGQQPGSWHWPEHVPTA